MAPHSENPTTAKLLHFMRDYGKAYLSSGGPTSRLEDRLTELGSEMNQRTEVFGTPTGIFISTQAHTEEHPQTGLSRIKEVSTHLGRLTLLEKLLDDLILRKMSVSAANRALETHLFTDPFYSKLHIALAAFTAGTAVSYGRFFHLSAALFSGLITMFTWCLTGPLLRNSVQSSIFRDFLGALLTLFTALLCQRIYPLSFDAYAIGGLVLLVPGLALTNSISELAEQNLVSGTVKLMHAILTVIALGLAFLIVQEFAHFFGVSAYFLGTAHPEKPVFVFEVLTLIISVLSFGVIFKVPPKSLVFAAISGMVGWFFVRLLIHSQLAAIASFLASFVVGLFSLGFGRIFRVPSQVFSVPGITALLPGMLALSSFKSFAMGEQDSGLELSFKVTLAAGSIVFGLFCARIPFSLVKK